MCIRCTVFNVFLYLVWHGIEEILRHLKFYSAIYVCFDCKVKSRQRFHKLMFLSVYISHLYIEIVETLSSMSSLIVFDLQAAVRVYV